jgi:hypothetical protein
MEGKLFVVCFAVAIPHNEFTAHECGKDVLVGELFLSATENATQAHPFRRVMFGV